MVNNRFIKKLATSQVNDLVNFVFPNFEPGTVTFRDDNQSLFKVHYDYAGATLNVVIDDFEGFADADSSLSSLRHVASYMDAAEQIRFHAWMYHNFREAYLKELARFLNRTYRGDCR